MAEQQTIHRLGARTHHSLPRTLENLLAYWLRKCEGRRMPARGDLPTAELKPWMGYIALIEIRGENAFRVRLSGTNLIRRFGREATGMFADELAGDIARHLRAILRMAAETQAPVVAESAVPLGRSTLWHADLVLPLTDGDAQPGTLLLASYPLRES
jgi:hypothetical protein